MSASGVENLHFVEGIMNADKYINVFQNILIPQIKQMLLTNIKCIFQ